MNRRGLVRCGLGALAALAFGAVGCQDRQRSAAMPVAQRWVSLSPGITETVFAIGAQANLVAVSDYCDYPPEATRLPRVGSSMTPHYEAIARLAPTLILSEAALHTPRRELEAIGHSLFLPWLSLSDIVTSVERLGALSGDTATAHALAERLKRRLSVPAPAHGPRVLLVLDYTPGKLEEVYFIRRNSLHGAALRAAGGRNAVAEDVHGVPRLSLQRLLEIDPDLIIVLTRPGRPPADRQRFVADFAALEPLSALRSGGVSVLEAPDAFALGPRILDFTDRLAREITRLEQRTQP